MKNLRKILSLILATLMLFSLLSLASCNQDAESGSEGGSLTLVLAGESIQKFEISLDEISVDRGLVSTLDHLKNEGKLDYSMTLGMLDFVGELENDYAENNWIYIFTSVDADKDVSQYAETVEYEGSLLVSAGVGAENMTVAPGAVIYITTIHVEF